MIDGPTDLDGQHRQVVVVGGGQAGLDVAAALATARRVQTHLRERRPDVYR